MKLPQRALISRLVTLITAVVLFAVMASAAEAAVTYPSDSSKPNLVTLLSGMNSLWQPSGSSNLHGTVLNAEVLAHNDEQATWINNHATSAQQFKALQDANYTTYQLPYEGLGQTLGPIYLQGLKSGALPLTNALLSNITGYVGTEEAKSAYSYPRPYLRSDTSSSDPDCAVATYNGSSLRANREGKSYAEADGNLKIVRLAGRTDNTGTFAATGTSLGGGYSSYCSSGSFPSGHATAAYLGGVTLATLLPELAPSILGRTSEQSNSRIVLGVHYPLDIIGGRMDGEVGVAARWSDPQYRKEVLIPAREELVGYLEAQCGGTLAECIAKQAPYEDNPYAGAAIPGGSAQIVNSNTSDVSVYTERLTYSFPKSGPTGLAPAVPANAANLLITTFPTLTPSQRTSVLAQTEIESGYPLDKSATEGSWQRLNLAAAMSATVQLAADGSVNVVTTGGTAKVVAADGEPTLTSPDAQSIQAGGELALVGAGLTPGGEYKIVWASETGTVLGSFIATGDGSAETSATIPVGASAGSHTIQLLDSSGDEVLAQPLSIEVTTPNYPQSVTTTSPDGNTVATVFVNGAGELDYSVAQNGETVVQPSRLGLVVAGNDWGKSVTLGTATPSTHDETYPLIGTHDTAVDNYDGNVIPVEKGAESKLGVEIRVFNTGVAVRYDLAASLAGQTVSSEDTTFAFNPNSEIVYQPYSEGTVDDLQGDTTEGVLSSLGTKKILELPTIESPDGREYTNITEANVRDWPASSLTTSASGSISSYYWATDNGAGTFKVSPNTLHSPFRVLTVASNLTALTNSDIITDVNAPIDTSVFPGGDTSWIKPGVSAWESLNAAVGQSQTVSVISNMIKNASAAKMPEVLVEGQMADSSWGSTTAARYAHLKELVQQGLKEPNPVHVWLWSNYNEAAGVESAFENTINYSSGSTYAKNSLQNPDLREAWLNLVKETGVVGIKIDHEGNETETKVNLFADVDKAAAERKLMVEFHNPLEPTGLNRTYPNEVGREAIRGVEINYAADQDTYLPFTRYVDGTADFTPLLFSNSSKQGNATWAHEVASTVLYTNPYLQISENPANLKPGGIYHTSLGSLVEHVPTTWKRSWVLPQSSLGGRLAGVVRESENGEYWIALVATPGQPLTTQIPLGFLPEGTTYNADVYSDKTSPSTMSRKVTTVDSATTLSPTLQSGGGYLVRITTEEIENPGASEGEGKTFQIGDEEDMSKLREFPAATFDLSANIDMTKPWTPIPTFSGTINGNGHTIENLEVAGTESKALVLENQGTIQELGFVDPKSVVKVSNPTETSSYTQSTRVAVLAVTNDGLIAQVYTSGAVVEGGWRGAPIAAENNGTITNSYTVDSKVVGNWEVGAIVGWNSEAGVLTNSYVAEANVTSAVSNGGIFTGYGYAGTVITGDVVYSGKLSNPNATNQGRVNARENGTPTYGNDLSLNTATINGAVVTGGAADNKNGKDTSAAELAQASTYEGIGWNFDTVWTLDPTTKRPVLRTVEEVEGDSEPNTYKISTEAGLNLIREHPEGTFDLTANITMQKPWAPVASFEGTLNGDGHTITGLRVEGPQLIEGAQVGQSKAFILENKGTIRQLGFLEPTSIITVSNSALTGAYTEANRVAIVVEINKGTIEQVYTKGADVEGGWRAAPIAAMNEAIVTNCYTDESKVVANWESGGLVGWTSATGSLIDNYVAGANVLTTTSSGGILNGYGYTGTKFTGNVVYSGKLTNPNTNQGRINARENTAPTYSNNLSLSTATINGANVTSGTATNKNGLNKTEAELQKEATYTGIGWDFTNVWTWSSTLKRPVLKNVEEAAASTGPGTYSIGSEADLSLLREHPHATFNLTANITMTKPWAPIPAFAGTLNGAGHTISGLNVEGAGSKAFIDVNLGTIKGLGFLEATSIRSGTYVEAFRVGIVTVINAGTIEQVYTSGADVEGGWRTAPIAAMNEAVVINSYTVNSKVVSNWESGALVGFNKEGAYVKNDYVAGAKVNTLVSNGGLLSGYGYLGTAAVAATKFEGDVVYSGALTIPTSGVQGRVNAQEKNGVPTYVNLRSLNTATINGAAVTGGTATNKNGLNATEAELQAQTLYTGLGWDFTNVWTMSPTLKRPVLKAVAEVQQTPQVTVTKSTLTYQVGASPSSAELLKAAGAATNIGTLTINTSAVNFGAAGEYTAPVGATNNGVEATPVPVTIRVVAAPAISVAHGTVSYPASATTPVTAAQVIADSGASVSNGGTVTADVSAVKSDAPGEYTVTLHATDANGFQAEPTTLTVQITAATTQTALQASAATQVYDGPSPVTLTATVTGGDGSLEGAVEFTDGAAKLSEVALSGGTATYTLPANLAVGGHELVANFVSAEAASSGSSSNPVNVTVETAQGCKGESIVGAGPALQGDAQRKLWAPAFAEHCPGGPTVGYEEAGSAAGVTAWGFNGGSFDHTKAFVGTDEAPTAAQIKASDAASGTHALVIPVAQTAIAIAVNPPVGCEIEEITNKQLESIMRGNLKIWNKVQTATGPGCVNAPITRVVRAEASGTTYQLKAYLNLIDTGALACTEPAAGWKQLEELGAGGRPDTVWPEASVGGCSATTVGGLVTAQGGAGEIDTVNATEGSVGYAVLPEVEARKSGRTHWLKLQNNGLSNKLSIAQTVRPVEPVGDSAECDSTLYGVPKKAKSSLANVADGDWSAVTGGNPDLGAADPSAYPLCMLTYDVALSSYSKAGFTAGQELTAAAYLGGIVTAEAGQEALETSEAFYAPLPTTGNPDSDVLAAARLAASEIGF